MKKLNKYRAKYDFQIQLFDGVVNIYVAKDGVDLYSNGGFGEIDDAVDDVIKYLDRINKDGK